MSPEMSNEIGVPVIGKMAREQLLEKLAEIGEEVAPEMLEVESEIPRDGREEDLLFRAKPVKPWMHTSHALGYLGCEAAESDTPAAILSASEIKPDSSLVGSRIRVTLDAVRIASYPGKGEHKILIDLSARNQLDDDSEQVHFGTTVRAQEGESAAIFGFPLFVGLGVGSEGLAIRGYTVNVRNTNDEKLIGILESDPFRQGLQLLSTAQPAAQLLSELALGITRLVAGRHRNIPVQDFHLGLDFSSVPTRPRLAEGSYFVAQVPFELEATLDWESFRYDRKSRQVVSAEPPHAAIPFNYMVFSISRQSE